jgi:hypothetical protein
VLDRGRALVQSDDPAVGIDRYFGLVEHSSQVSGSGGAEVRDLAIWAGERMHTGSETVVEQGAAVEVRLLVRIKEVCRCASMLLYINDESMAPLLCVPLLSPDGGKLPIRPGLHNIEIPLGRLDLNAGKYSFVVAIRDADTSAVLTRVQGLRPFRVFSQRTYWGRIVRPAMLNDEQIRTVGP